MYNNQEEIKQADETLHHLAAAGRIELLALINNRILKMRMKEEFIEDLAAQKVLNDLESFLRPIIYKELVNLGDAAQMRYHECFVSWDLLTVAEVELEFYRTHSSTNGASESERAVA
jgi:hypothetical protein